MASIKEGNNQYFHMVHGKHFISSICHSTVYVDRHTATPMYIKDKLCTRQNYCIISHIVKGICHHIYNWLLKFLKKLFLKN